MTSASSVANHNDHASHDRVAIRYFIEYPTHGWRHIGISRATAVYRGEYRIEEFASQTIRVATASLAMKSRLLQSVLRLNLRYWKFDERGYVNQQAAMAELVRMLTATAEERAAVFDMNNESDVNAIKQLIFKPIK